MAQMTKISCPHCQRSVAVPTESTPAKKLRCPHCQQIFTRSSADNVTRSFDQQTSTTPLAIADAQQETATNSKETQPATLSFTSERTRNREATVAQSTPQKVGRFEIRRELGEGAFGKVYEAHDPQLDRAVALKVAKLNRGDSAQRVKRFLREAKAAAVLRHPHIVPVYEYGQDGDQFYIASAFIQGRTLADDLDASNALDLARAARIVRQLADALSYAHSQGIVHRDVKPANVMLDEKDQPMLMDFGLAARQEEAEKLTHAGQVMGTPRYMAPEQAKGATGHALPASDQYSLGVMLFEMITGKPLFEGTIELVMFHHMETDPPRPSQLNKAVSRDLETICLKCLAKLPEQRYASAHDLEEDLRRYEAGEPIVARPIGVVERVRKWSARNRLAASFLGAAACLFGLFVLTLIVGSGVAGYFAWESSENAELYKGEAERAKLKEDEAKESAASAKLSADHAKSQQAIAEKQKVLAEKNAAALAESVKTIEKQAREARTQAAVLQMERGLGLCQRNQVPQGLLWLARSLQGAPPDDSGLQLALRGNLAAWQRQVSSAMPATIQHQGVFEIGFTPNGKKQITLGIKSEKPQPGPFSQMVSVIVWDGLTGQKQLNHLLSLKADIGQPILPFFTRFLSTDKKFIALPQGRDKSEIGVYDSISGQRIAIKNLGLINGNTIYSANGTTVAAFYADFKKGGLRLWDFKNDTVREIATEKIGPTNFSRKAGGKIRICPKGKTVALFYFGTGGVDLEFWDLDKETMIGNRIELGKATVTDGMFTSDGREFVVCRGNLFQRWDVRSQKRIDIIPGDADNYSPFDISPDNQVLATLGIKIGPSLRLFVWNAISQKPLAPPIERKSPARSIAVHPSGKFFAVAGIDEIIQFWSVQEGASHKTPLGEFSMQMAAQGDVRPVLTTNDKYLVIHSESVKALDATTGQLLIDLKEKFGPLEYWDAIGEEAVLAIGKRVHPAEGHDVKLWNLATRKLQQTINVKPDLTSTTQIAVHPEGKLLAFAGVRDGLQVQFFDATTGKPVSSLPVPGIRIDGLGFFADGKKCFVHLGKKLLFIDCATWRIAEVQLPMKGDLKHLQFSRDGSTLAAVVDGKNVGLWDAKTYRPIVDPIQHEDLVTAFAFSPDGRVLATATGSTTHFWESRRGIRIGIPRSYSFIVTHLIFRADSSALLVAGPNQMIAVPPTVQGSPDQVGCWIETLTRMELSPEGAIRLLDDEAWNSRQSRLKQLGEPKTK